MNTFQQAVRGEQFTLTGQLRLHRDTDAAVVISQARCLSRTVDAVAVTDNPNGNLNMAALAAAALLLRNDIDPVVHIGSRDRNRLALQSEILGAAALGVTSMILQRGDKLPKDYQPKTRQVFDTGAKKLVALAAQISAHRVQRKLPELLPGTIATVFDPAPDWEPLELKAKTDAGTRFIQTQICMDMALLRRWMTRLVAAQITRRCHVVVSLPVLPSAQAARWLHDNLRGSVMPGSIVKRLEGVNNQEQEGIALCAELLQELKQIPGVGGANLVTPQNIELIPAAIDAAKLRR